MIVWRHVAWKHARRNEGGESRVHTILPSGLKRARMALRENAAARRARTCGIWGAWRAAVEPGDAPDRLRRIRLLAPQSLRGVVVYIMECSTAVVTGTVSLAGEGATSGVAGSTGQLRIPTYDAVTIRDVLRRVGAPAHRGGRGVRRGSCGGSSGARHGEPVKTCC